MANKTLQDELKKPDEFISFFERVVEWLAHRHRGFIVVVLFSVLLLAIISFTLVQRRSIEATAADALVLVLKSYPKAVTEDTGGWQKIISDLDVFLSQHKRSKLFAIGQMYQARAYAALKQFDKAQALYQQAAKKIDSPFKVIALEGLAQMLMEQKLWTEAEPVWQGLAQDRVDNPLRVFHLWNLAICLEAQDKFDQALVVYEQIEQKFPDSSLIEQVGARVALLKSESTS